MNTFCVPVRLAVSALAAVGWAPSILAQSRVVVPQFAQGAEQPSTTWLPGIGFDGRLQLVIDPAQLASVAGRNLLGLEFRRDTGNPRDFTSATADVVVRIGIASTPSFGVSANFAANAPAPALHYQGPLSAPASSVAGYAGWADPHVIRITFTRPFAYAGGPLAIEVEGSAPTHSWWPVDAAVLATGGGFSRVGTSCSPLVTPTGGSTMTVRDPALQVGATAIFGQDTAPGAVALLLFGLDTLANPISLAAIGAPACSLYVDPLAATAPVMSLEDARFGGLHEYHLAIPADPAFAAATFVVQGLELGASAVLATSEALACQIASTVPSLGVAAVWAIGNGTPHVSHELVPVIGILHD
ncbi:MAG: hypothetical protein HZB39_17675 [Planctomycetes bacterium]|nr:hypothetical protein [Planctomycetota bacterium]